MARLNTITWRVGYWVMALLAVGVALASMRFLTFNPNMLSENLRQNLLDHPFPFFIHVTLGPLALLLGAWQFVPVTRRTCYHRWAGRLYVVACLIGALAGFAVAFTTTQGPWAATAFLILAVLWFGATLLAYLKARARDFEAHRRWMIRSYALTCSAITLRLVLAGGMMTDFEFSKSYIAAAWLCWIINLAIAEAIIRFRAVPVIVPRPDSATPPAAALSPETRTSL